MAILIASLPRSLPPHGLSKETIWILPRLIVPKTHVIDARGAHSARAAAPVASATMSAPSASAPAAVTPAPSANLQSFGQALFGCAPEKYADLPPAQQAHCRAPGEGLAIQEAPNLMGSPTHVKDPVHWAAELAREKSPTLLPCLGGLDIMCLIGKLMDGTLDDFTDPRTWPAYETKQYPPEELYKLEKVYDDWHKAHPLK